MVKRCGLILLFLVSVITNDLFSQAAARIDNRLTFADAESWILFEDYNEALQLYLQLIKSYPTNSNLKYRIGQCYLYIPGQKELSIGYLEDAVQHINTKYKEGRFKETGAPYDALYYLANSYRINNQLDRAIETYELFKKNMDTDIYNEEVVDQQIQSCRNAKELMGIPFYEKEINLGNDINDDNSEYNPVISEDENTLVFTKSLAFYNAIMYTIKANGVWSGPQNLNEPLKIDVERDLFPTSLSSDGKTIYLYGPEDYDGVIFTTTFESGTWGPLVRLNDNINTKYWESHATISHDNKKLYFTSNRKGTIGGLDIYVSERDSSGDWGPAVNLGPAINTPQNEETPFLSKDDKTLYFSSRGHFNIGGYDIFYSSLLDDGKWSAPLNVGYPLNSTDDDVFFNPVNEGYVGYFAKYDPNGYGEQDIYRVEIFSEEHPRKFIIRGIVKVADLIISAEDRVRISAMNIKNPDQTIIVYSNPETGEYEFQLPQGKYELTYDAPGSEKVQRNLDLALTHPSDSFVLPGTILPKTDFIADLTVDAERNIKVIKGDTLVFPVKAEPGSLLTIEHWLGDSLLYTEKFAITDTLFNYKVVPQTGNNRITFKLTDKFNNTSTTDVFITREKGVTGLPVVRPEYDRVIARKQVAALAEIQKNRADGDLKKIISVSEIQKQDFGNVDDMISFLKEKAVKNNISTGEVDKLALKVAVMDNILTQAAVELLERESDGELKQLLSEVDISSMNLKTWTDLQEYIMKKSGGKITPEKLNMIAADVLSGKDPSISILNEKILAYSENDKSGAILKNALSVIGARNAKEAGTMLQQFYNESLKNGMSDYQMAGLFAAIGSLPDTDVEKYLKNLSEKAEEPLRSWLNGIDLKKEKIKTPADLILFILRNIREGKISGESFFNALAKLISDQDIPAETIKTQIAPPEEHKYWYLWFVLGGGLIIFFIVLYRRRKKDKNK